MVLSIELDNNVWVFAPGETIRGKVVINKTIWNKVEGLTVRFLGKVVVGTRSDSVTVPSGSGTDPLEEQGQRLSRFCIKVAPQENILLDETISLLHSWKVLKPGRHEFDFSYDLPTDQDLPASLKVKGAKIHYEFVTKLKTPRDDYQLFQTPFSVRSSVDEYRREDFQEYLIPFVKRETKDVSGWVGLRCCSGGSFSMELKLLRRLTTMGERFSFILTIWNNIKRNMDDVRIKLVREFLYKGGSKFKSKEVISEISGPSATAGGTQIWNSDLPVPANTYTTNFIRRDTYELNYKIQVSAHPVNQPSKALTIKCPIILVPENIFSSLVVRTSPTATPTAPPIYEFQEGDIPPPTYAEATAESVTEDASSTSPLCTN